MELSHVIIGSIVTEKSERLKLGRTYTIRVNPMATKIDVKNALRSFYDVDVTSVRVMRAPGKTRALGGGKVMQKRDRVKKMLITLTKDSKPFDVSKIKS